MSKLDQEDVTAEIVAFRIHTMQRELDYHKAISDAATAGLDDCIELYVLDEEGRPPGDEGNAMLSTWAHRVQLANLAVSQVANDVAAEARILTELTSPAPEGETQN